MNDVDERVKLQFEYAWRWFDSHARQRMTMFYYYLVLVGVLTNAWVLSYDKRHTAVAVAVSMMGIVTSAGAICFDVRNRQMSKAGEDVLEELEKTAVFPNGGECRNQVGPLCADRQLGMREGQKRRWRKALLKHKFWIRLIEAFFGVGFLFGAVLILWRK